MSEIEEIFTEEYQRANRPVGWRSKMFKKQIEIVSLLLSYEDREYVSKPIIERFRLICGDAISKFRDSEFTDCEDLYEDLLFYYKEMTHYWPKACQADAQEEMLLVEINYNYRIVGDMINLLPMVDKDALAQTISKLKELCTND